MERQTTKEEIAQSHMEAYFKGQLTLEELSHLSRIDDVYDFINWDMVYEKTIDMVCAMFKEIKES